MIKRNVFIIIVFFIFAGLIFPQSITVTNPAEDEVVVKGSPYTIKWTKTGTMAANVKIRLFNTTGTTKIKDITNSTANDGIFTTIASIFDNVAPGNYMIRVKTTDDAVSDDSGIFNLEDPSIVQPAITVTSPAEDEVVNKGSAYTIKWTKTGTMVGTVKIRLFNSTGTKIKDITNSTSNDGIFTTIASIFDNVAPGNYMIRVKTTDDAVSDDSGIFKLEATTSPFSTTLKKAITTIPTTPVSPYPRTSKTNIPVIGAIPYVKSTEFESEPRVLFTGPPASPRGRLFYYQIISAKIGNKGFKVTKDTDIVLTAKRRIQPAIDAPFPTSVSKKSVVISPRSVKEIKLAYYTKTPGVFENTLSINVNDELYKSKSFYSKSTGIAELYLKVKTKVKTRLGHPTNIEISLVNMGDKTAPSCKVGIYDYKTKIMTVTFPQIIPKKTITKMATFVWTKAIANIWFVADCLKKVDEVSRKNNMIMITMTGYPTDPKSNPIKVFLGNKKDYDKAPSSFFCK